MNSSPILRVAFLLCASFAGISCVPFQRQAAQTRSLWHQPRCVKEDDAQRAIAIAWVRRCESAECMDPVRAIGKNVAPWAVAKRGSVLVSIPHAPPNTVPKE